MNFFFPKHVVDELSLSFCKLHRIKHIFPFTNWRMFIIKQMVMWLRCITLG